MRFEGELSLNKCVESLAEVRAAGRALPHRQSVPAASHADHGPSGGAAAGLRGPHQKHQKLPPPQVNLVNLADLSSTFREGKERIRAVDGIDNCKRNQAISNSC